MKWTFTLIVATVFLNFSSNKELELKAVSYIDRYSELAVAEMYRSGIPASITIAQGMHESAYGTSRLSTEANNHFGIKCKSYWTGPTFYHKDDDFDTQGNLLESCFRAYQDDIESYIDHSNFLMNSSNYIGLFNYSNLDYLNWANGLQRNGYATDPQYANKLIKKIENYNLYEFDHKPNPINK